MRKGWIIVFAGMGLNLTLGVIYAWSVFKSTLAAPVVDGGYGWTDSMATWPYALSIVVWAILMIPAGRLQDKFGPRIIATIGAISLGVGLYITSFSAPVPEGLDVFSLNAWGQMKLAFPALIGIGIFAGAGMGLGYACATPVAIKWFPPTMKGRAAGVVVAGLGFATVYIAPLASYLIGTYGINSSFRILAVGFAVAGCFFSQILRDPPAGYVPEPDPKAKTGVPVTAANSGKDYSWTYMVRTPIFYLLWFQFVCGTSAGLMIIGNIAGIVKLQSGGTIAAGFMFAALLSLFNASGRVCSGFLSDKLGANRTLLLVCLMQIVVMLLFPQMDALTGFIVVTALCGFNYGACMPLFPTITAGFWGTKNLGMNYGVLYSAWGVAGVVCPMVSGYIKDTTGSYNDAYLFAAILLGVTVLLGVVREKWGEQLGYPIGYRVQVSQSTL